MLGSLTTPGLAIAADLQITRAWVQPADKTGVDTVLHMTVVNDSQQPDALMRVRCPIANFSERYTVDRGEGSPARRAVPSIPIAARATVELDAERPHVMLLQTRELLTEGTSFPCTVTFRQAGALETSVKVLRSP